MENTPSAADSIDAHKVKLAFVLLFISIGFGMQAAVFLVNEPTRDLLNNATRGVFLLTGLLIIRMVVWKIGIMLRISASERHQFFNPEGFVVHARNQACYFSWGMTLFALFFSLEAVGDGAATLPARFFILLTLFISLSSFSLAFFFYWRTDADDESEIVGV